MSFGDDIQEPAPNPLDAWPAFAERVRQRLDAGRAAYGDRSFERPPDELLAELQQEALDLAGWGFVLFERIERMRRAGKLNHSELRYTARQSSGAESQPQARLVGAERGRAR